MNRSRSIKPAVASLALALVGASISAQPAAAAHPPAAISATRGGVATGTEAPKTSLNYVPTPLPVGGYPNAAILADDGTRVIAVSGDLESADTVAIVVPGAGTTRASLTIGPDPLLRRADDLRKAAHAAGAGAVAVIAFLGYTPPQGVGLGTLDGAPADAGATELAALMSRLPDAHVTWVCHSYGALVCGRAIKISTRAPDDIVLIGAPGAGAQTAADLAPARAWAAVAPNDPISLVGVINDCGVGPFGVLPTDPAFGAHILDMPAVGHSGYLRPGVALDRVAAVVAGAVRQ